MRFELEQYHRNVSDEELITDLQRVASELGKRCISGRDYDKRGKSHYRTFSRRFQSWSNTCAQAGLKMARAPENLPFEELFRNLEEIWTRPGRQPRYQEVQKPLSNYSVNRYKNRFGSWRNALEAFVAYMNDEEASSSARLIEKSNIKPIVRQHGSRNINWRLRFIVMRRDKFKCKASGKSPATEPGVTLDVDHIKAWTKGGHTVLENLQTLCTKCNIGKSDLEFVNTATTEVQNV